MGSMPWKSDPRRPPRRAVGSHSTHERHHGVRQPFDRHELERSGWRTTLEYRENLVRHRDGMLDAVEPVWYSEGERVNADGEVVVVTARGSTPAAAWSRLRARADLVPVRQRRGQLQRR